MTNEEPITTEVAAKTEAPEAVFPTGEFIKTNTTLLVWLFFLAVGGGLMALYYARIGYLPDIEWRFSLVYLAVVSFIGGAFGILLLLSVFLPGFIWAEALICDPQLVGIFCYEEKEPKPEPSVREPSVSMIFLHLGIPFGVNLVIAHIFLPMGVWPYYIVVTVLLLLVSTIYVLFNFTRLIHKREKDLRTPEGETKQGLEQKKELNEKEPKRPIWKYIFWFVLSILSEKKHKHRVWKYVFWFNLSILLSQTAILLVYYITAQPKGLPYFILTLICTFVVLISNHIVAARYLGYPRQAIIACLVASLLLLVAADRFVFLPERIMALYGYGGEENKVKILVNDDGAALIEKLELPNNTCGQMARNNLCGVEILSGIGSEYFIKLNDKTFTLPKAMVISRSATARGQTVQPCR